MSGDSGLERFKADLETVDYNADLFVSSYVFNKIPILWSDDINSYLQWKIDFASRLEIDPTNIQVVGSARLGYSLNPKKNFKKFDNESDIDVAIISPWHFEQAWLELRQDISRSFRSKVSREENRDLDIFVKNLIFYQTIPTERILPHLSFGRSWIRQSDEMLKKLDRKHMGRELNFRIYRSHEALRSYQILSSNKAITSVKNDQIEV